LPSDLVSSIEPREGWLEECRVGWLQGSLTKKNKKADFKDKDIVIASIESLSQCDYSREMLQEFGLVIVDEMHHLGALTLSQVLPKLPAKYILGISATPDRNDGLEHVLYWLAGPTCFTYKRLPSITGISNTVQVRLKHFNGGLRKEVYNRGGGLGFASMITNLAMDEERNAMLLDMIQELKERKKILIVTSIVDHGKALSQSLSCLMISGGCSPLLIAQAKSIEQRIVVATYQFLEEGYDDPYIDTLVMALPRSKIQQVVGRAERTHENKLVPLIIDIIDTFSVFEGMSWKRRAFYKSRGFEILK
jgi:superfamily II DNA or RNA helicase